MSFHVIVGDLRTLFQELGARHIGFLLSRMYSPPSEEHSVEVLFEDPLVVVTGPNNPLARRRKLHLAELLDEPWTLQPRDNNFGSFALDALHAAGLAAPRITVATTSSNLRGEMLATGRYLTMVPRYWVRLPRRHPSLRILPVEFPNTRLKIAVITLKNRSLSRATELFSDGVRDLTKPLARG
jgi:DNA-binding transcriptional LysR family regulator